MSAALTPWIINRRQDLAWFIGSALPGYALLALAFSLNGLPTKVIAIWALVLNGPHVYSTLTRVWFDSDERIKQRFLLIALIPICAVCLLLTLILGYHVLFFLGATWGHFHISKQHMGFVMLYKRKSRERSDFNLDKHFTLVLLVLPFVYYASAFVLGQRLLPLFLGLAIGFASYYLFHQMGKSDINIPKMLLLSAFIPLTWLAYIYAAADPHSTPRLIAAIVTTNAGHSFQYLRLMWFHNNNRYSQRSGLLGLISNKWIYFFSAAMLLALPDHITGYQSNSILPSVFVGFLLLHYLLDSKLWRVRGDAELSKALGL